MPTNSPNREDTRKMLGGQGGGKEESALSPLREPLEADPYLHRLYGRRPKRAVRRSLALELAGRPELGSHGGRGSATALKHRSLVQSLSALPTRGGSSPRSFPRPPRPVPTPRPEPGSGAAPESARA